MKQVDDLSRSLAAFDQESAVVAVIELSNATWLVAGTLPGVARRPLKKLDPDPTALEQLLARWRLEAEAAGRQINRVIVAYEAGRDGFRLARWLRARGVETHVIHPTSVAVSREHRPSKTDRLDTAMLMRVFLGWLRGERGHCSMVGIPTLEEEDAKRPSRERESLVGERTRIINSVKAGLLRLGIRYFNPAHPAGRLKETRNSIDRELQRRSHARTSPITIRGGGDTRNAVASTPREECARRLGASHSKRMAASWSRSKRT
jgi:transposase